MEFKAVITFINWVFGGVTFVQMLADGFNSWKSYVLLLLTIVWGCVSIWIRIRKEQSRKRREDFDLERERYEFEKKSPVINTLLYV